MLNKLKGPRVAGFPVNTFNTLVDHVATAQRPQQGSAVPFPRDGFLKWKNASGSDAPMGAIIRPTAPLDVGNFLAVSGTKPDGTLRPYYLVALTPLKDGAIGDCTLFEPGLCHYYTSDGTPAFGESWGVESGQWYLRKGRPGFFILGNPSGSGSQARVKAIPTAITSVIGKLAGTLSQGSSATVNVWGGAGGSEATLSLTITAFDWFLATGETIVSGTKVKCDLINGVWYVTQSECPSE